MLIPLLEGLIVLEGLALLEGLAEGLTEELLPLPLFGVTLAEEGLLLLFATCNPLPLGLGPLGPTPPPGCGG